MATLKACVIDPDDGEGTDYTSLNAAEAAHWKATSVDIVGNDEYCVATCYCTGGTADTTPVTIDGMITDATHTVTITVHATYRYSGTWPASGNYYRMDIDGASAIYVTDDYVKIYYVPIRLAGTPSGAMNGIYVYGTTGCVVEGCLAVNTVTETTYAFRGFYANLPTASQKAYFGNNLAYDFAGNSANDVAFQVGGNGTLYAYNNTAVDSTYGFRRASGVFVAKNNIAWNNATAEYAGGFSAASTNNGCKSGSTAPGSNPVNLGSSATTLFADYANDDFRLHDYAACPAYRVGADLSADSDYAITTDFGGDERYSTPCLGWDEIVVVVHDATGTISIPSATVTGVAQCELHPVGELTIGNIAVAGVCTIAQDAPGALTAAPATVAGVVKLGRVVTCALTLPAATLYGKAQTEWRATGALSTAATTLTGRAQIEWRATGAMTLGAATVSGVAFQTWNATAQISLAPMTAAGTIKVGWHATGSLSIAAATVAEATKVGWHATGAVSTQPTAVSASVPLEGHAFGSFTTGGVAVSGVAFCRWMVSGVISTGSVAVAGVAQTEWHGTAAISTGAVSVAGVAALYRDAPGTITAAATRVRGACTRTKLFGGPARCIARIKPPWRIRAGWRTARRGRR
jgi:hypothetical protein